MFKLAALLMMLSVAGVSATPQTLQACVPGNSCGNGKVVGINVDYFCVCDPNFVGQYCDRLDGFTVYDFKGERTKMQILTDQFCTSVQTKCIHGNPQLTTPQPVCA
ncbi:hypothetical protein M3Y97_00316000 [Aphelenchoides bicaudatus]|nr:hypothetical protein M3Y97_00316000 [Aphelenchoides bicaudatus]